MANLTKLRLNSNEYALGSTITKINVNGTIYGIGKDRNTVGVNGAIGMNNTYPNLALNIGTTPQNTIAKDGNRYAAIQVPDGLYDGSSYVGVKSDDVKLMDYNIRAGVNVFGVNGNFTNDAVMDGSRLCEGYSGYSTGIKHNGTLPNRTIVGKNGSVGISSGWPNVALTIVDNCQFNRALDGSDYICINVPLGYYNGSSYVGCHISKICADGADTFSGIWSSDSTLISDALGFNFELYDTNYIRFRQNYTHTRVFRLFAATSRETGIHVTKSYGGYKDFSTSTSSHLHPYLDTIWEDTVEPGNCYRVHMDGWPNVQGIMILYSWRKW